MPAENPIAALPVDPREWELSSVAALLGFGSTAEFAAALASVDRGYTLFVLRDERRRRVISAPHKWLKTLQRRAYDSIIGRLPLSDRVYCCPDRGVVAYAEQHLDSAYMTVMDVADCFPSTSMHAVFTSFEGSGVPRDVAGALTRLTTHHGFLPQGPPTSPAVLNVVFRPIDEVLMEAAARRGAIYTRYMDDLAFSGSVPLDGLDREVIRILRRFGYRSNPAKRRVWGPNDPHTVTKIVVSTTLNPTPEFLKALTQHLVRMRTGQCQLTDAQIRGKINWVAEVNRVLGRTFERQRRRSVAMATHTANAV